MNAAVSLRALIVDTCRVLDDRADTRISDATAEEIANVVLVRLTPEWGARFGDDVNVHPTEHDAEEDAVAYGGELVSRLVGPWTAVSA